MDQDCLPRTTFPSPIQSTMGTVSRDIHSEKLQQRLSLQLERYLLGDRLAEVSNGNLLH